MLPATQKLCKLLGVICELDESQLLSGHVVVHNNRLILNTEQSIDNFVPALLCRALGLDYGTEMMKLIEERTPESKARYYQSEECKQSGGPRIWGSPNQHLLVNLSVQLLQNIIEYNPYLVDIQQNLNQFFLIPLSELIVTYLTHDLKVIFEFFSQSWNNGLKLGIKGPGSVDDAALAYYTGENIELAGVILLFNGTEIFESYSQFYDRIRRDHPLRSNLFVDSLIIRAVRMNPSQPRKSTRFLFPFESS